MDKGFSLNDVPFLKFLFESENVIASPPPTIPGVEPKPIGVSGFPLVSNRVARAIEKHRVTMSALAGDMLPFLAAVGADVFF